MAEKTVEKVREAVKNRDMETLLGVLEEADRALTGACRFARGEYWRQFVEIDFQRFFALLDEGGDAINTVKLGDEQSKIYVNATKGEITVYIQCPDDVGDVYEATWEQIK